MAQPFYKIVKDAGTGFDIWTMFFPFNGKTVALDFDQVNGGLLSRGLCNIPGDAGIGIEATMKADPADGRMQDSVWEGCTDDPLVVQWATDFMLWLRDEVETFDGKEYWPYGRN